MSDLPKRVSISEEGPREGFQSEKKTIPVADKVRLIEALADTGLKRIACVSYVNPKRVPTMADAEEVASRIDRKTAVGAKKMTVKARIVLRMALLQMGNSWKLRSRP